MLCMVTTANNLAVLEVLSELILVLPCRGSCLAPTKSFPPLIKGAVQTGPSRQNMRDGMLALQTLDIPVDTTPYLVVDDPREVAHRFGQPGNFVDKGREPYKGAGYKKTPHNDLKPGALYGPGRYLVQNKGRVLYAAAKPFPEGAVKAANQTEQAIILAIAMQASPSSAILDLAELPDMQSALLDC